jgi:septal ring factor EnvC (AmiA/AmiB activator)
VENLLAQIRALEKENEALKNNINLKEKEIKSINERLKASGERESRLEAEIDDLRSKLIKR